MKILDIYRTAPYGETLLAADVVYCIANCKDFPALIVPCALVGLGAAGVISFQFKLRSRLKAAVEEYGYRDEIFYPTVKQWCDRQTARVVARESGHLDDYIKLCERNRGIQEFKSLPNF